MSSQTSRQIREMVLRWADAVHTGDLDGVLADHAPDIVMFDVPPPEDGVRGQRGVSRHVASVLRMAARGSRVRHRGALGDCGRPTSRSRGRCCDAASTDELVADPDRRLRLTLGFRKDAGRWIVTHEHHSFTHPS